MTLCWYLQYFSVPERLEDLRHNVVERFGLSVGEGLPNIYTKDGGIVDEEDLKLLVYVYLILLDKIKCRFKYLLLN